MVEPRELTKLYLFAAEIFSIRLHNDIVDVVFSGAQEPRLFTPAWYAEAISAAANIPAGPGLRKLINDLALGRAKKKGTMSQVDKGDCAYHSHSGDGEVERVCNLGRASHGGRNEGEE